MNEQSAMKHLIECGVEINMLDPRSPEQIVTTMIERGVIPPLRTLETEGMTLPADRLAEFQQCTAESVADKINC